MRSQVTGVLIVHNDCSLLKATLSTVAPLVDRLLIVDGAYEWVAPFCKLNGENSAASTDELLSIVEESGIPFDYHQGIWKNETHKRAYSVEKASSDMLMLVDSDELFEIDRSAIDEFGASGRLLGECLFPLYFSKDVIGLSVGLKTPPRKPIFINRGLASVQRIVDSLFLLVPEDERSDRATRAEYFPRTLGSVHHLSSFRSFAGAHRRARFYNLLSMRIAKKVPFLGRQFGSDTEFYELIQSLDARHMEALDSSFQFHRIAAAFPAVKSNQTLVPASAVPPSLQVHIDKAFDGMLSDRREFLEGRVSRPFVAFANKPMFFDVTNLLGAYKSVQVCAGAKQITAALHWDRGLSREVLSVAELHGNGEVLLPDGSAGGAARCIAEITPHSSDPLIEIELGLAAL